MTTTTTARLALLAPSLVEPVGDALTAAGLTLMPADAGTRDGATPRVLVLGTMPSPTTREPFLTSDGVPWWDLVESTMVAVFETLRTAHSMAESGGGRIVLVADDRGITSEPGRSMQSTVGAAAIAMTKSLAREFGPKALSTNAVVLRADQLDADTGGEYAARVASVIAFLADLELPHLTGQVVACQGATIGTTDVRQQHDAPPRRTQP
ncbi:MAG TPA: SDR family oxidoreductase [Mycobacterium sp.]